MDGGFSLDYPIGIRDADDDLGSLFGDGDDAELTSHFMEAASDASSQILDNEPASALSQDRFQQAANNNVAQLSLPVVDAQSAQRAIPVPQLTLPAVPDPASASLSHQDGHTSGGLVVSTHQAARVQVPVGSASFGEVSDDAGLEASLQHLWEATYGDEEGEQTINTQAEGRAEFNLNDATLSEAVSSRVNQNPAAQDHVIENPVVGDGAIQNLAGQNAVMWDNGTPVDAGLNDPIPNDAIPFAVNENEAIPTHGDVILASQVPGFRYGNSLTNLPVRLPRRIDMDQGQAEGLAHYLTLNRKTTPQALFDQLELSLDDGKQLGKAIIKVLKEPQVAPLVQLPNTSSAETKRNLIRIALYMLKDRNFGATWFGASASRKLFWPQDSTIILIGFVRLTYRHFTSQRTAHQSASRAARKNSNSPSPSTEVSSPPRTPSTANSRQPSAEAPSKMFHNRMLPCPDCPPPQLVPLHEAFLAMAEEATITKERKHSQYAQALEQQEVVVPANAGLRYNVYVKDITDARDLIARPMTYLHTEHVISCGAYGSIINSLRSFGQAPTMYIHTPAGRKKVECQSEWDQAVLLIYNLRRSGGVVEVDVYV